METEEARPAKTSGTFLGNFITLFLLFGYIGLVVFAWVLYVPSYIWPWDHTKLANRVPALWKLAQVVSRLSLFLPIIIVFLMVFMRKKLSKNVSGGVVVGSGYLLGLILVTSWILGYICYESGPLDFAMNVPYVYHDGTISKEGASSIGTFIRTNDTATCSYGHGTASPFKEIRYKFEDSTVSFEMKCLPDNVCGHGLITYSDREVYMDIFLSDQTLSVSSLAPERHARPGPWQNKTSLYTWSGEKAFVIERSRQVKVFGRNESWRDFGICWSAVILSKWPQN